jgi:hypothetical protein
LVEKFASILLLKYLKVTKVTDVWAAIPGDAGDISPNNLDIGDGWASMPSKFSSPV